jgi:leader peptidase (prepilin peptidase) / N-methyltransferase
MFGAAVGSFLNVVLYRLPRGESLSSPPSRCPACGTPIAWRDNVPILSWLWLRGRCRECSTAISAKYPLVELLTAIVFAAAALVVRSML